MKKVDLTIFKELAEALDIDDFEEFLNFLVQENVINLLLDEHFSEVPSSRSKNEKEVKYKIKQILDDVGFEEINSKYKSGDGDMFTYCGIFKLDGKYYKATYSWDSYGIDEINVIDSIKEVKLVQRLANFYE